MKLSKSQQEAQKTAAQKYTRQDIASLLALIEMNLDNQPEDLNWAQIGDLKRLRSSLMQAATALTGLRTDEIETTLEDGRTK